MNIKFTLLVGITRGHVLCEFKDLFLPATIHSESTIIFITFAIQKKVYLWKFKIIKKLKTYQNIFSGKKKK